MKTIYSVSIGSISAVFGAVLKDAGYTLVNDIVSAIAGLGVIALGIWLDRDVLTDVLLGFGIGYSGVSVINAMGGK